MVNGTQTQVKLHCYGKAQSDECQLCRKKGNEGTSFFPISSVWNVRNDMEDPIRVYETISVAEATSKTWLWERGVTAFS